MATQTIKQGSDAKFRINLTDENGNAVNPADCDLRLSFYTSRSKTITVECRRGDEFPAGLSTDGGALIVSLDRPNFPCGRLHVSIESRVRDASFPDKFYNFSSGDILTDITVVK